MKKLYGSLIVLMSFWVSSASGLDSIQLSGTKKTDESRKSSAQTLRKGSTQLSEKSQYYRFDYKPSTTGLPAKAELRYVVLQENIDGRIELAVRGAQPVDLLFGQPGSVESDPFELSGRSWNTPRAGNPSVEQDVYGYGIRIVSPEGKILAEKYSPTSARKDLEEAFSTEVISTRQESTAGEKQLRNEKKRKRKVLR